MDFKQLWEFLKLKIYECMYGKGEGGLGGLQRHRSLTPVQKLDGNGPEESETTNYSSNSWTSP